MSEKIILAVILIYCFMSVAFAQTSISEVNQMIDDGAYEGAIAVLEENFSDECCSKELYENLGYAYYHSGDLAKSILYYEKALRIAPRDKALREAMLHVKSELPIQITVIPDFILLRFWRTSASLLSASYWSILQIVLSICLFGVLYVWLFRKRKIGWTMKRWSIISALILAILVCGLLGYFQHATELGGNIGISSNVHNIYQAPDERSGEVVTIGPGNKVYILDTIGDWYKVQLEDKDAGWIKKENIFII